MRNQQAGLRRFKPQAVGLQKVESGISSREDYVLYHNDFLGRIARRLIGYGFPSVRIKRALDNSQASVIHSHFGPDSIIISQYATAANIPHIVTLHGNDVTGMANGKAPRAILYKIRLRRTLNRATRVVAISDFIYGRAVELGAPPNKTVRHYIGIPLLPTGAPDEKMTDVVFIGRLVEKKGVSDLLSALAALPAAYDDIKVKIIGDGPLRSELEKQSRVLPMSVTFLGRLSPSESMDHLRKSRIFAGPSKTAANGDAEGLGMVFLEAASAGIPVVAYAHGGVPEAVMHGRTGYLAREGDVKQLSAYIEKLLTDREQAFEFGMAGQKMVEERFDILKQTPDLEKIYEETAKW
ncbi:glycosyltransferase [Arthrobacter cheniae]|uniref:glycosyltransferase n=1 Tax=Arthrobacter cheniae TaxID=1258888 RepID=UPI002E25D7AB